MKARDAEDREVVDSVAPDVQTMLFGARADQRGDLRARRLDQRARTTPGLMADRRRIAMRAARAQAVDHRLGDARVDRRRRGVVEIDRRRIHVP